jgi:hypothetical protein
MLQLGEFDLQLAFMGTGALREDIENQTGTVEHAALQRALQIALLTWAQGMIEQDELGVVLEYRRADFLELAGTYEMLRISGDALAENKCDRLATRGLHQLFELLRILGVGATAEVDMHQNRALTTLGTFEQQWLPHSLSSSPSS